VLEGREEGSIEPEEIEFGSDSYFDLLAEHPETGPWLALGSTVRFRLGERIVEIVDPTD